MYTYCTIYTVYIYCTIYTVYIYCTILHYLYSIHILHYLYSMHILHYTALFIRYTYTAQFMYIYCTIYIPILHPILCVTGYTYLAANTWCWSPDTHIGSGGVLLTVTEMKDHAVCVCRVVCLWLRSWTWR